MKRSIWSWLLLLCSLATSPIEGQSKSAEADYVIVGVGTAGAVLAKELSDDKHTSVIALCRGKNLTDDPLIKYSRYAPYTVLAGLLSVPLPFDISKVLPPELLAAEQQLFQRVSSLVAQLYQGGLTIPQINDLNRQLAWVMALPEGGASSINAGAWCRGTNQVYARWEAIAGPEWSVDRILEVYKKLEHYHGQTTDPAARGYHGPLSVRQVAHPTIVGKKFTQAIINATNTPFVLDYNDPNTPIGTSSQLQLTQSAPTGKYRVSSATAFLNKHVMTPQGHGVHGRKLRVLFDSIGLRTIWKGNKAIGVQFTHAGKTKRAFAKKGVVVCAGLYSSHFLLHSGVGPQDMLQPLNIPVIYHNPNVGQGLADQPHVVALFATNPKDTPLTSNSIFGQISWLPTPGGDPTVRQMRFSTAIILPPGLTLALLDLCQPLSRGSISINSANPLTPPVIDLGEFNNPQDLDLFQSLLQVYLKNIAIQVNNIDPQYQLLFPDPAILNDVMLTRNFILNEVGSNMHFQSHCRMAPLSQGGVVDSTGHVYGVRNLIVADDSIVPQEMDGSPMASAYLIAANIARLLLRR